MNKKIHQSLCYVVVAFLSLASVSSAQAEAQRYSLDPTHTTVAFLVDHIAYAKTLGLFTEVSGSLTFDSASNSVSDISVVVATSSVNTANKARDKHVRSKDFLNVKKYPEMTFEAQSATVDASGVGQIEGELTLLGQTHSLVLDVQLNKADKYPFGHKKFTLGVSAKGELMRSQYGMNYGVANAIVGDSVQMIIEIEATAD